MNVGSTTSEYFISRLVTEVPFLTLFQLRTFRMKFAEAHGHFATAAKLLEEEIGEKGASRAQETQIIKVVGGEGKGGSGKGREREREREEEGDREAERKGGRGRGKERKKTNRKEGGKETEGGGE